MRGYLDWRRDGLGYPDRVLEAIRAYRTSMDVVGQWLDENVVEGQGATTPFAGLYRDYVTWCELNHERPVSKRALGDRLTERVYPPDRGPRHQPVRGSLHPATPGERVPA